MSDIIIRTSFWHIQCFEWKKKMFWSDLSMYTELLNQQALIAVATVPMLTETQATYFTLTHHNR